MGRGMWLGVAAVSAAAVLGGLLRGPAGAQAEPAWLSSWDEGQKVARQTGKPIFLVFR